jgi:hypothetical protein
MAQTSAQSSSDSGSDAALRRLKRLRAREQTFQESLARLEERLAAPSDASRFAAWIEEAAAAFDALRPLLQRARLEHREALDQIAAEDLGLQPRIDEMQAAEGLLEQKEQELADQFAALQQRLANGDDDQATWQAELERIARDGLEWVSGVRAQDLAVHTWLTESLTRDRGVVD